MSQYKKYITVADEGKDFISYEVNDINTDERVTSWVGNKLATNRYIQAKLKTLTGKILTIIDASLSEGKQNKCVKDLIRQDFLDMFREVSKDLIDMRVCSSDGYNDGEIPSIVSAKDILGA